MLLSRTASAAESPRDHGPADGAFPEGAFDVAVIGAGVVGCAVARRFTLEGARVVLIERAADILDGASKGNSAILHTGFDAPPGSVEQHCIETGHREYLAIRERLGLPVLETGALVLAWSDPQVAALEGLMAKARENGITDIAPLDAKAIAAREPRLSSAVKAGFLVPHEHVIDPWTTPYLYALQAIENGATLLRGTTLRSGGFDGDDWTLDTSRGPLTCRTVINCAGLYGDRVETALFGAASFAIRPRKGQFLVYDKAARRLIRSILLPVPSAATKGIVVCPTIFGNLLVGPTAEEQESREDSAVRAQTLVALKAEGERIVPGLRDCLVTATYAGLRPATASQDYLLGHRPEANYFVAGGIRSTGLSSALGIAAHLFRQYADAGPKHAPIDDCRWPHALSIAEQDERDWQRPDNGGIVCHCELVTRREIERALDGPLPAASLAGLKRRTRVTMGRCQGFFCSAELTDITAGRLVEPLAEPLGELLAVSRD